MISTRQSDNTETDRVIATAKFTSFSKNRRLRFRGFFYVFVFENVHLRFFLSSLRLCFLRSFAPSFFFAFSFLFVFVFAFSVHAQAIASYLILIL